MIPVKLSAEAAFVELIFGRGIGRQQFLRKYIDRALGRISLQTPKRSMQDYFKRVALRLAAQARERKEAEGGQGGLGLGADERDDETGGMECREGGLGGVGISIRTKKGLPFVLNNISERICIAYMHIVALRNWAKVVEFLHSTLYWIL